MTAVYFNLWFEGSVGDGMKLVYREFPGMVLDATYHCKDRGTHTFHRNMGLLL